MGTINLLDLCKVSWHITHPLTVVFVLAVDRVPHHTHAHTQLVYNPSHIAPCVACLWPMLCV